MNIFVQKFTRWLLLNMLNSTVSILQILMLEKYFFKNLYQYIPYQYADVTWVEKSTKQAANNYGAEILGGCSTQLIVKAAITGHNMVG